MVLFNYSTKELTAKVVYYGPGLCGKTTNLQWVHEKLPIKNKGKMLSLATETDRTLFFDFLPIEIGAIRGMKTRIQLYTVPGQVFYNATRRMVLKGADAVVFVCDSQEAMLDANLESYENMRQNLEANEIAPDDLPVVLQYNKRDLPNALPIEILNERINPHNYPFYEAVAVKGTGVEDTLKAVTKLVFKSLSTRYGEGASAAAAPGRAPGPPRQPSLPPPAPAPAPVPAPPRAPEPLALSADDLLGDLGLGPAPGVTPPPGRLAASSATLLPTIELEDESTPEGALQGHTGGWPPAPVAAKSPARVAAEIPTRPPVPPPPPPPPPPGSPPPQNTLITKRDEAEELRRRIASPGISQDAADEVEMDLEELDEIDHSGRPPQASLPPSRPLAPPAPVAPAPPPAPPRVVTPPVGEFELPEDALLEGALDPEPEGATEVEVPIDIEVAPGTTRISINLKLVLTMRRR